MKQWLQKLKYNFAIWMQGRYGHDELSIRTSLVALICMILSWIPKLKFLYVPAWVLLMWTIFRCYSKNLNKRRAELSKYMSLKWKFKNWFAGRKKRWQDRKTHKYIKCKNCKTVMRVPKGKGKIQITCPKCGNKVIKKT